MSDKGMDGRRCQIVNMRARLRDGRHKLGDLQTLCLNATETHPQGWPDKFDKLRTCQQRYAEICDQLYDTAFAAGAIGYVEDVATESRGEIPHLAKKSGELHETLNRLDREISDLLSDISEAIKSF